MYLNMYVISSTMDSCECQICLQVLSSLFLRKCCNFKCCSECFNSYLKSKIELGLITIECINTSCNRYIAKDEILSIIDGRIKDIYHHLIIVKNCSENRKTCPNCNYVHHIPSSALERMKKSIKKTSTSSRINCLECNFDWCFLCHAPWHNGLTCKQYLKGDILFKKWAKGMTEGQINAQRCPNCHTFIQKISGCDHMHCNNCQTGFCYKCGEKMRKIKFFGDHYSKLSVFGCKYRYKSDAPLQRKFIRGLVFLCKVIMVPIVCSLGICTAMILITIGAAFFPLYSGITVYKKFINNLNLKR